MARKPEGWKVGRDVRTGVYWVRFTIGGERVKRSTGQTGPRAAHEEAARIYAAVLNGGLAAVKPIEPTRRAPITTVSTTTTKGMIDLCAEWITDMQAQLDETTVTAYEGYVSREWVPFFHSIDKITEASGDAYVRARLREVRRRTLLKELSALRGFLRWCRINGHTRDLPVISSPARTATGVEAQGGLRRKVRVDLTETEIEAVLAALPMKTKRGYPVKAFFTAMYATSLRRSTLFALVAPGDYSPGRKTLTIRDEADKCRFGRELPLSRVAREALDSVCPAKGPVFPPGRYESALHAAGLAAKLSEFRARHLSFHDLRHAALTHLASKTSDLVGLAYLAGHRDTSTTAKYTHSNRHAAERVVAMLDREEESDR